MWTTIEICISICFISAATLTLCAAFYGIQLITERFILFTLPEIGRLYEAIRYPDRTDE